MTGVDSAHWGRGFLENSKFRPEAFKFDRDVGGRKGKLMIGDRCGLRPLGVGFFENSKFERGGFKFGRDVGGRKRKLMVGDRCRLRPLGAGLPRKQ